MSDGSELCPEGDWDAVVQSTEADEHQSGEYMVINVGLVVTSGGKDYNMFGRINLSEKASGINRSFFRAIGFDPDENPMILHENPLTLNGNKTRVQVEHKLTKNGESYHRVGKFLAPKLAINDKIKEKFAKASEALKAAKQENRNG